MAVRSRSCRSTCAGPAHRADGARGDHAHARSASTSTCCGTASRPRLVASDAELGEQIPFSGPAKKVLELVFREALRLGHNYVGTEHLLLGLLADEESPAAQLLGTG